MPSTPLRRQYLRVKQKHPDAIVLFRLGDFYETFDQDAHITSGVLGITLTAREMGKGVRVPMAGIPYHALDSYLGKLIHAGHKVAICEQLTEPGAGLVDRDVVRVVTPGTIVEANLLEQKSNNYLAALIEEGDQAGLSYVDITTGEFATAQMPASRASLELERVRPAELLLPKGMAAPRLASSPAATYVAASRLDVELAREALQEHFGVATLEGFGCAHLPLAIQAAAAVLGYLQDTQKGVLGELTILSTYSTSAYMVLDAAAIRNLELFQGGRAGSQEHSLLGVLDLTRTPMGGRLLRRWLGQPLMDIAEINARLDGVECFYSSTLLRARVTALLSHVGDIERLTNRIKAGIALPREVVALRRSLETIKEIAGAILSKQNQVPAHPEALEGHERVSPLPSAEQAESDSPHPNPDLPPSKGEGGFLAPLAGEKPALNLPKGQRGGPSSAHGEALEPYERENLALAAVAKDIKPCEGIVSLIAGAIVDDPPSSFGEGGVIRDGFSPELDELRKGSSNSKEFIATLEHRERERTGIKSLKVGFNRVFGYYIEVTTPNLGQVPADYIRKQTIANGERYFTPELKEYESFILNAQSRIEELEGSLFRQVCRQIGDASERLLATARGIAHLDVYATLGEVASRYRYVRPVLTESGPIEIKEGRHPVVERTLPTGTFVPNDTHLDNSDAQLHIITGPNMSGKSTYLRQVALLVLMAQMGSFVPAASASIGIVDRIFTRVGLQDDLATGQSTFMVEMVETAQILNNATPRSLIILDEIGRGTSTYDGLSIAQAVAEHIHNHPRLGAKTLFATHYHELVELANYLPRVKNYNVAVAEDKGTVVFLHKIVPGGADKSYGIHVAQLAGLPKPIIGRAREVLNELESGNSRGAILSQPALSGVEGSKGERRSSKSRSGKASATPQQMPLFGQPSKILQELLKLDISSMTPLEAITKLYELQQQAKEEGK